MCKQGGYMRGEPWMREAACAPDNRSKRAKDLDWHSSDTEEKYAARAVCQSECEVRKECIQYALENKIIHGIWGGVDDYEIRRTLSVDQDGEPKVRDRMPRCPYCLGRKLSIEQKKTRHGYRTTCCNEECGLTWNMAVIPEKLRVKNVTAGQTQTATGSSARSA